MSNRQEALVKAEELLGNNEISQAVNLLEDALAKDPKSIDVRILLAKLKAAMGDLDAFDQLADEALRISLGSAESYMLKGMSYGFKRDFNEAVRFYEMAAAQNDAIALVHTNLGIARRETGDYKGAETALRRARELDEADPEIGYHLAQTLAMQNRVKESIDELIASIKLNPLFLPPYLALGAICAQGEDYAGAVEIYKAAISARPDAIDPKERLADLYLKLEMHQEAVALQEEIAALRIDQ